MKMKAMAYICIAIMLCFTATALVYAVDTGKDTCKQKSFWQKLFNYPANVTKESAAVVSQTGKDSANVVIDEVKTVGKVISGDVKKAGDLVVGPIKGTAETAVKATEGTVKMPVAAANEDVASFPDATKAAVEETARIASETTTGAVVDAAKATTDAVQAPAKGSENQ